MKNITICFTYFKSLTLANLAAALYSVRRQDLSCVNEIVIVDNDTSDFAHEIQIIADALAFPVPVRIVSFKHSNPSRTHAWSSNVAIREATTPWVFFTRADYLLDFSLLEKLVEVVESRGYDWNGFVTSNGSHLANPIADCEGTTWRTDGPALLKGVEFDYSIVDTGVYLMRRDAFDKVEGFDERLVAWGHPQTYFQHKLHLSGVEFVRIPEALFWHPEHGGVKDSDVAHQQSASIGFDLNSAWTRYHGRNPYA